MVRSIFKKVILGLITFIVILNLMLFFKRHVFDNACDLDILLKDKGATIEDGFFGENYVDVKDVFENHFNSCLPGVPCRYEDSTDLRIIILTFKRWQSLTKLLNSLDDLQIDDGDRVSIEIWIDRSGNEVDERTLRTARSFSWKHGPVRVHVQRTHVGILGQWIDTWTPTTTTSNDSSEIALILEDDISVSPYAYRWLKAAFKHYRGRSDVAGITLQSESLIVASSGSKFVPSSSDGVSFLYMLMGSWGFAPNPDHWKGFQEWYHEKIKDPKFQPYVDGLVMNAWFKKFQIQRKAHTMWTMWFIYYCHQNHLFTVYNNLNAFANTTKNCLAVNRREPGLHFSGRPVENTGSLLCLWKDEFVDFKEPVVMYGFNGKAIKVKNQNSKVNQSFNSTKGK